MLWDFEGRNSAGRRRGVWFMQCKTTGECATDPLTSERSRFNKRRPVLHWLVPHPLHPPLALCTVLFYLRSLWSPHVFRYTATRVMSMVQHVTSALRFFSWILIYKIYGFHHSEVRHVTIQIISHLNLVHALASYALDFHFTIILPSSLISLIWPLLSDFQTKYLYVFNKVFSSNQPH
jgi:hypothetical protein